MHPKYITLNLIAWYERRYIKHILHCSYQCLSEDGHPFERIGKTDIYYIWFNLIHNNTMTTEMKVHVVTLQVCFKVCFQVCFQVCLLVIEGLYSSVQV